MRDALTIMLPLAEMQAAHLDATLLECNRALDRTARRIWGTDPTDRRRALLEAGYFRTLEFRARTEREYADRMGYTAAMPSTTNSGD